jgi:hypothetical protein
MIEKVQILDDIEDQISVEFTGKINILRGRNRQHLGNIIMVDGELIYITYDINSGLKAFYNLVVESFDNKDIIFVIEPEIIENQIRNIHFPYSYLLRKVSNVLERYKYSRENRPPNSIKLVPIANFILDGEELSSEEFETLKTMVDYNKVEDIYKNTNLLDFEITTSLVSLRRKKAIKVIKQK